MKTEAQKSKFIADGRNIAKVISQLQDFQDWYVASDGLNTITDSDFTGVNEGLVAEDMVNFQVIVINVLTAIAGASNQTVIENYKNV